MTATNISLYLASGSQIRRALLEESGLSFYTKPVDLDEEAVKEKCMAAGFSLAETALELARRKALLAAHYSPAGSYIIGADQILDLDGEIFSKPRNMKEARDHLIKLRGKTHFLHTAVVLYQGKKKIWEHIEKPKLKMRRFTDNFLDTYLDVEKEKILSSVGAYRLEGPGIQLFSSIEGHYDSILGLPRMGLFEVLRKEKILIS
ncbi:Maf family protein [Swingsia samuiensis]|uniref:Nucleoside triphosphate pyrophosphatase n=1 Tax=Swingsia samuiensis TaxID=1293412 RepID=A0A4Y6UHB4_9PROT|nr:Maf family protein [Swingsia samuiensis]QDH16892.1 septum formation protein Maf [Swingsia samuiensis]